MLDQWKKAVVHLECVTDSEEQEERAKRIFELKERFEKGEIPQKTYDAERNGGIRDIRFRGTALFISHNGKRYLLTARHVLFDEITYARRLQKALKDAEKHPEHQREEYVESLKKRFSDIIFPLIFRVYSLDEVDSGIVSNTHNILMNLGSGTTESHPYTFSHPDLDLAIISLDKRNNEFADDLIRNGYYPIPSELIADGPSSEGAEIFTVGFPVATSVLGIINQSKAMSNWSSDNWALPVFSWGKVSMLHEPLQFYWCDITTYPGNSGGPIVENGKLIGVVSSQAVIKDNSAPGVESRIPFVRMVKSIFVKELLEQQEKKDNLHA